MLKKAKGALFFLRGYATAKLGRHYSAAQIATKQKRAFVSLKKRVLPKAPFYIPFIDGDLEDFPIINKSVFMANFNRINTAGLDREACMKVALQSERSRDFRPVCNGYSVGLSSGTSGKRGMFVTSPEEQAEWAGYIIGKMLPVRFKQQRVALFLRSNNNLYESSRGALLRFLFFDLLEPIESQIEALERFNPDILIAPAKTLRVLAGRSLNIAPQRIISAAEVLEGSDKAYIEEKFDKKAGQLYQCTEGFLACTCTHGNIHMNEDIVIVEKEWVDQASGRFNPILTDLRRSTQPVLRYKLDDILIENTEPCPCGSSFMRIDAIEGRNDDVLWLPKSGAEQLLPVFPDLLRRAMLMCASGSEDYRIVQRGMTLCLSFNSSNSAKPITPVVEAELSRLFTGLELSMPSIQFIPWDEPELGKKIRRIQCVEKPSFPTKTEIQG
jgi:putative adenylate-forming enzyme